MNGGCPGLFGNPVRWFSVRGIKVYSTNDNACVRFKSRNLDASGIPKGAVRIKVNSIEHREISERWLGSGLICLTFILETYLGNINTLDCGVFINHLVPVFFAVIFVVLIIK